MNQENLAKLIVALRSGEYNQGDNALRVDDKFCCLGVACDISGMGTWEKYGRPIPLNRPSQTGTIFSYVVKDEDGIIIDRNTDTLPAEVARWLGIEDSGSFELPVYVSEDMLNPEEYDERDEGNYSTSLADLNDSGLTFAQIADILENAQVFEWEPAPELPEPDETD